MEADGFYHNLGYGVLRYGIQNQLRNYSMKNLKMPAHILKELENAKNE